MEKENEKFPVNKAFIQGYVQMEMDDPENDRVNVILHTEVNGQTHSVHALFSGKLYDLYNERRMEFYKQNPNNFGKRPTIKIPGTAFVQKNKYGNLKEEDRLVVIANSKFEMVTSDQEQAKFAQEYKNPLTENYYVEIRCKLASDIREVGKEGSRFKATAIKHTFMQNDTPRTWFANLVIPSSIAPAIKSAEYKKDTPILLRAQPGVSYSYEKDGKEIVTATLKAQNISHDLSQTVGINTTKTILEETANQAQQNTQPTDKIIQEQLDNLNKSKRTNGLNM